MKTYEKPRLAVISLSGNDQLCGSCAGGMTLYNNPGLAEFLVRFFGIGNPDDGIGRDDFEHVFGTGEQQCSTQIESYCKFNSQGPGKEMIAWS